MERAEHIAALEALYEELPALDCKQLCQECCGPLLLSRMEAERLRAARPNASASTTPWQRDPDRMVVLAHPSKPQCPLLRKGRCTAYAFRPLICRVWYCVENEACPHGCVPERWLTEAEGLDYQCRVWEIADEAAGLPPRPQSA